jgi:hypothetical protein
MVSDGMELDIESELVAAGVEPAPGVVAVSEELPQAARLRGRAIARATKVVRVFMLFMSVTPWVAGVFTVIGSSERTLTRIGLGELRFRDEGRHHSTVTTTS